MRVYLNAKSTSVLVDSMSTKTKWKTVFELRGLWLNNTVLYNKTKVIIRYLFSHIHSLHKDEKFVSPILDNVKRKTNVLFWIRK